MRIHWIFRSPQYVYKKNTICASFTIFDAHSVVKAPKWQAKGGEGESVFAGGFEWEVD